MKLTKTTSKCTKIDCCKKGTCANYSYLVKREAYLAKDLKPKTNLATKLHEVF